MRPTAMLDRSALSFLSGIAGCLVLLVVSGCGLAMSNEDQLDRGEEAFADGDFRAAIIDAKDVLLDEPDNVRGRLLLGRASVKVGDGPSAEKELRRAIALGTAAADVAPGMARALLIQGKFQEVLDDVPFEGLASSEVEAEVRAARGDAYLGLNQPEAAREMYSSALELQPENLDARLGIVSSFVAENNFAQARGGIDQILETYPDNPRVWLYSGAFNARSRNFESAEANFKVALDLAGSQEDTSARLQALAGVAESLLEQQEVDAARPHVEQLAIEAPQSLQTMSLIARIAYMDEDWKTAQQNLQQILQAAPNYRPAQMLLGAVHLRSGNLSQAEMYLSAAVAAVPHDVRARQMLAETLLQMRKADEAQEALAPIVGGPDADPMSLQMAARASLGRRDIDEALEYLRRSVEENPGQHGSCGFSLPRRCCRQAAMTKRSRCSMPLMFQVLEQNAYRRDALGVLTAMKDGQSSGRARGRQTSWRKLIAIVSARSTCLAPCSWRTGTWTAPGSVSNKRPSWNRKTSCRASTWRRSTNQLAILASAASRYNSILADQPDAAWAMFALGRIAFRQEDLEAAAENFRRASAAAPDNPDYRLSLARAERQLGNGEQAQALLEDNVEATLEHFPSAVMLGALRAESGDLDGAMDIAARLQERYPDNPASYAFEGEMHFLARI